MTEPALEHREGLRVRETVSIATLRARMAELTQQYYAKAAEYNETAARLGTLASIKLFAIPLAAGTLSTMVINESHRRGMIPVGVVLGFLILYGTTLYVNEDIKTSRIAARQLREMMAENYKRGTEVGVAANSLPNPIAEGIMAELIAEAEAQAAEAPAESQSR